MSNQRILVPVCNSLTAAEIARRSFWLARNQPSEIYLVEMILPRGLIQWLLSPIIEKRDSYRLKDLQRRAIEQEHFYCETDQLSVPNLIVGIVEAAWSVKPNLIVLAPQLRESLGQAGLADLKRRLGEICHCVLLLFRRGLSISVEPCYEENTPEPGELTLVE